MSLLPLDEAIQVIRANPRYADLVRDAYLGRDVGASAERFFCSGEFAEVVRLLGAKINGAVVVDLGAGVGIASYAMLKQGASKVYAIEPDPSDEVGQGAIRRLRGTLPIEIVGAFGEDIPLQDHSADIVYCRQVLHHTRDLPKVLRECHRVLKNGGIFFACREHVVDDAQQLAEFLASHPVHQLAGGENAYHLEEYVSAIKALKWKSVRVFAPWDSPINAFPRVRTRDELKAFLRNYLQKRGVLGKLLGLIPYTEQLARLRFNANRVPGRMYSFLAIKD